MPSEKRVEEIHFLFTKKLNETMLEETGGLMKEPNLLRIGHVGIRMQLRAIEKSPMLSEYLLPLIKEPAGRIKNQMKIEYKGEHDSEPTSDELEKAFEKYMFEEMAKGLKSEPKEEPISKETIEKALKSLKSSSLK